jgi:hypothetical protein
MICRFFEGSFNFADSLLSSAIHSAKRRQYLLQTTHASTAGADCHGAQQSPFRSLDGLLVEIGVMMVVPTMVMVVYDHYNLSLCRIGHREAEEEN